MDTHPRVGGRVSNAKILQEKNGALLGEVKNLLERGYGYFSEKHKG